MGSPTENPAFPAKAGIHLPGNRTVEEWVPAFAGNAIFWHNVRPGGRTRPMRRSDSRRIDTDLRDRLPERKTRLPRIEAVGCRPADRPRPKRIRLRKAEPAF